jgi:hypothetical protein
MTTTDTLETGGLESAVEVPHEIAVTALDGSDAGSLAAVAWCSAHLAAADRALYAAAERHLADGRRRVRALRAVDHRLQQALCRLDRRLTGDAHLCEVPVDDMADEVRRRLHEHAEAERAVVAELATVLDSEQQERLIHRLAAAMRHAPTRPHPHTPHTPLSGLVTHVDAGIDRIRDLMDNRVVPTPQVTRPVRVPGRWGCYVMGTPYPSVEQARR